MNKGFQSLPEHVQKKIDPDMARKYEDGGEAESRKQQVINKAIELFGDASEFSIMKVLKMLSGPMPMSFAAEVVNRAQPQAAENLRNSGSELMGKVGQAAQTVGGYTLAPYIAKGMGFDRAANALGLPYDDEGNMIPGRMPKYPPENKADGGAVMQRPLFRNMGGPAAPMPQDMAPPPMAPPPMPAGPEQELMAVEQSMEGVGRNYVENMAGGIDAAEDVTSMINALRGNEAPLEARYAELAGYVGEADASQTPESVLAMVQPTILMTEEGAVDSGIGQLMQGIAGSDMETPTGDPTAMGQGVGELMAMGAGSTPPQNFRQGGEVQHFSNGGVPVKVDGGNFLSLNPYLERAKKARLNAFGSPEQRASDLEEQKRLSQAQVFFDIAQAALAAGAPTATPMSAAERLANAATQTQLFDRIGQRAAGFQESKNLQRQQDQQMQLSSIESAEKSLAAEENRRGTYGLEILRNENKLAQLDKTIEADIAAADTQFGYTMVLNSQQGNITSRIQELRLAANAAEGTANRSLQKSLAEKANSLQEKLVEVRATADLNNRLEVIATTNTFDLAKMTKGQEFEREKIGLMNNYETLAREEKLAHDAIQNALNRGAQVDLANFNAIVQAELKQMGIDANIEAASLANAVQQSQFMITKAQEDHRLLQGDEKLEIAAFQALVDKNYKAGKLALEDAASKVVLLGSKPKTDQIEYISNVPRLDAYANGTLGDDTTTFEQAIADYLNPTESWDSALGKYVQGKAPELSPRIKQSLLKGNKQFYNTLFGGDSPTATSTDTVAATEGPINLAEEAPGLMLSDGTINIESSLFANAPKTLFKPDIDYSVAIGGSRILPSITKGLAEGASELNVGEGVGSEGQALSQANKDLDTLANRLFSITVDKSSDDRVLKMVQEKLEKEVESIRPGGFLIKTDADALSSLNTISDSLQLIIKQNATKVPEFGGKSEGYKTEQVTKARETIIESILILNEVLAFRNQFQKGAAGSNDKPATEKGTQDAVDFLNSLQIGFPP